MIHIVNKRTHTPRLGEVYVFGNPFSSKDSRLAQKVASKAEALTAYAAWLEQAYHEDDDFRDAVDTLVQRHQNGETLWLVCWCHPAPCHGDVLKDFIEDFA